MTINICDRCGKKMDNGSYDYKRISVTKYDGWKYCPATYSLCKECANDFENFMEGRNESYNM